jgi:Uma2 family endonuclease
MRTLLKLRPADHGRQLSLDEFTRASAEEGYHYELIRGRVYVSPVPNAPEGCLERWIDRLLQKYADTHPQILNAVFAKARVFVPDEPEATAPEPDVAGYRDFPLDLPLRERRWQDVSPVLVVEVLSDDDPDKDLDRNVELYLQVPSIREYWVIDGRDDPDHPVMHIYRRRGQRWQNVIRVEAGETYETRLLPDFKLLLDPRG